MPQELVSSLEVGTDSVDFMYEILHAGDAKLAYINEQDIYKIHTNNKITALQV